MSIPRACIDHRTKFDPPISLKDEPDCIDLSCNEEKGGCPLRKPRKKMPRYSLSQHIHADFHEGY